MSTAAQFRRSSQQIGKHFGASAVTLTRGKVGLIEFVSGDVPTLTCSVAAEDATSLPLSATKDMAGAVRPGVTLTIAGHATSYEVQAEAEPTTTTITLSLSPGLESAVNGEAVTLAPRALTFTGRPIELAAAQIPADWTVAAEDEIWVLVPPNTDAGAEPRKGDRITSPSNAVIASAPKGRKRIEYLIHLTGFASAEAA